MQSKDILESGHFYIRIKNIVDAHVRANEAEAYISDQKQKELTEAIDKSIESLKQFLRDNMRPRIEKAERFDAEEYLNNKDIFNHPQVTDRTNANSYEVADLMADFANHYGKPEIKFPTEEDFKNFKSKNDDVMSSAVAYDYTFRGGWNAAIEWIRRENK